MRLGLGHGLDVGYRPELFGNLALLQQYPGAAAAYSLRNIDGNAATNVVRVRRSSDDAEADFTAAEVTNGTLTTWTGANDGFVVTWYDQSGNGRNFTQSTSANQAKLFNAGSLITDNGLPGVQFDNTDDVYTTTSFSIGLVNTTFAVFNGNNTGQVDEAVGGANYRIAKWSTDNRILVGYTSGAGQYLDFTESPTAVNQILITAFLNNTSTSAVYANGALKQSATLTPPGASTVSNLGSSNIGTNPFSGIIQEIIIYAGDKSADRADIETAINSHYSIY